VNFAVFDLILTSKLPSPLLSFILNLTTATHCTIIFHSLRQKNSRTSRTLSLVHAVNITTKPSHITPVLKSLHWLNINERIKYKLLSLTYKVLTTHQPQYLYDSISVQPCHNTRSSSMITLARPPPRSSLKITNRSFRYAAPCLWNKLPTDLREPRQTQFPALSPITHGSSSSSPSSLSPLASTLTRSVFHSKLKTWLFSKSFPP